MKHADCGGELKKVGQTSQYKCLKCKAILKLGDFTSNLTKDMRLKNQRLVRRYIRGTVR
jgi:tRNA(Ile2) C34 agmatinyltransferase TiaS